MSSAQRAGELTDGGDTSSSDDIRRTLAPNRYRGGLHPGCARDLSEKAAALRIRRLLNGRVHWLLHKLRLVVRNEPEWCCERCRDAASGQ